MGSLRQSEEWGRYLATQGWKIAEIKEKKSRCKVYIRKIPLFGSVIKIQRPAEIPPTEEIDKIARKHRAIFVKLEPSAISRKPLAGFDPDRTPNLPTKTTIVDLTRSKDELWRNFSQDVRQSVRKAQSNKLQVASYREEDKKFEEMLAQLHKLLKKTGQRHGFWIPNWGQLRAKAGAFGNDALLFLVSSTEKPNHQTTGLPLAGALILLTGETASYHHAASSIKGRELYAPYLLLWNAMKYLKSSSRPIVKLDLEGIYDPRYPKLTRRWKGFTTFKQKFGGKEIEYPRPLIKYYNPAAKLLFKLDRL